MALKRKASSTVGPVRAKKAKRAPKKATNVEKPKTSFLSLPAEIRIRVYRFLFPDKEVPARRPAISSRDEFYQILRWDGQRCSTAILATCQLIYGEGIDILYGSVTYELEVRGKNIFACMFSSGRSVTYDILDNWCARLHKATRERLSKPDFDGHRTALFSFVRNIGVRVIGNKAGLWRDVNGTTKKKDLSLNDFDKMFEVYDTRETVGRLVPILEGAPRLAQVHLFVDWNCCYSTRQLSLKDTRFILRQLSTARNLKCVTIGVVAPDWYRCVDYTQPAFERVKNKQKHDKDHVQLKRNLTRVMMSEDPAEKPRFRFAGVAALRELVYQFKNHGFFHSMCKALYDAVDAEASGNRKRFFSWQKKILDMWAEEEQRMRSTLDTAAALVAAIPTPSDAEGDFEDSQDGEEQDDAEDADDGQDEGDPSL